jgi:hypothetical protein
MLFFIDAVLIVIALIFFFAKWFLGAGIFVFLAAVLSAVGVVHYLRKK